MDVSKIDLNKLPIDKRKEFIQYAIKLDEKKKEEKVNQDFLTFVKSVWPDFVEGKHHKKIAEQFNRLAEGKINRLIINMKLRCAKIHKPRAVGRRNKVVNTLQRVSDRRSRAAERIYLSSMIRILNRTQ
ncbi:MAG: hypothetical protein EB028_08170 [Actinobacteria bacterium]|nr:hypothetical protein [Actinomycetota bacterium]